MLRQAWAGAHEVLPAQVCEVVLHNAAGQLHAKLPQLVQLGHQRPLLSLVHHPSEAKLQEGPTNRAVTVCEKLGLEYVCRLAGQNRPRNVQVRLGERHFAQILP